MDSTSLKFLPLNLWFKIALKWKNLISFLRNFIKRVTDVLFSAKWLKCLTFWKSICYGDSILTLEWMEVPRLMIEETWLNSIKTQTECSASYYQRELVVLESHWQQQTQWSSMIMIGIQPWMLKQLIELIELVKLKKLPSIDWSLRTPLKNRLWKEQSKSKMFNQQFTLGEL